MEKTERSYSSALAAVVFIVISCALTFITVSTYSANHVLAKPEFICTKVEQVGKNLDDVACIQYTHQKIYNETVALNRSVELMSVVPAQVAASKPSSKSKK